jgi:hypothetical protein
MHKFIRVIDTEYPLDGRMAHVYVFCLPPAAMSRLPEVLERMQQRVPYGVEQFAEDEAGLLIYTRDGVDYFGACRATMLVINDVLKTGLTFDPTSSLYFEENYGHFDGATTYSDLLRNPSFALRYMTT